LNAGVAAAPVLRSTVTTACASAPEGTDKNIATHQEQLTTKVTKEVRTGDESVMICFVLLRGSN
jgi:hypothetical protein